MILKSAENTIRNITNCGGCNLDGTFEYGKYVLFMTQSEHMAHHQKGKVFSEEHKRNISKHHADVSGENHPRWGKHFKHSDEAKRKISESLKGKPSRYTGKHHCDAVKEIIGNASHIQNQRYKVLYEEYKQNGGLLKWNDFRKAVKNGDISYNNYETP